MSTATSKNLTTDDRKQYARRMAVAVFFAVLFVLVLLTSWFNATYGGSDIRLVTVCSKHQMGDSDKTRIVTSNGTYRIDSDRADRLKRGEAYTITTTGWEFGDFSLKRTITKVTPRPDISPDNCD